MILKSQRKVKSTVQIQRKKKDEKKFENSDSEEESSEDDESVEEFDYSTDDQCLPTYDLYKS